MTQRIVECIGCNQPVAEIAWTARRVVQGLYGPTLEKAVLAHFNSTRPHHHNFVIKENGIQVGSANVLTTGLPRPIVSRR